MSTDIALTINNSKTKPALPKQLPAGTGALFPSKYIKPENLPPQGVTVKIDRYEWDWCMPKVGKGWQLTLILHFTYTGADGEEKPTRKGLIINKTRAQAITQLANSDKFDDWIGQRIHLTPGFAPSGKRTVDVSLPADAKTI